MSAVKYEKPPLLTGTGLRLAGLSVLQTALVLALGTFHVPVARHLAACYLAWGRLMLPGDAPAHIGFLCTGLLVVAFQWIGGSAVFRLVPHQSAVICGLAAHIVTSAVIIGGGWLI